MEEDTSITQRLVDRITTKNPYYEVPKPDFRQKKLTDWELIRQTRDKLSKVINQVYDDKELGASILAERLDLIKAANERMAVCMFKPSDILGDVSEWLTDWDRDMYEIQLKNAAMDILQEVWESSPDVIRDFIQKSADFSTVPYQPQSSVLKVWKNGRDAREQVWKYVEYMGKRLKTVPLQHDPDFIATMVYYAFPEVNRTAMKTRYFGNQRELSDQLKDEYNPETQVYERYLLRRAHKMYPDEERIKHNLTNTENTVRKAELNQV